MKWLLILIPILLIGILAMFIIRKIAKKKAVIQPKSNNILSELKPDQVPEQIKNIMPPVQNPLTEANPQTTAAFQEQTFKPVTINQETSSADIPEDSVLRRHYLNTIAASKLAITHPYPTDSTLRRHYESHLAYLLKTNPADRDQVAEIPTSISPTSALESSATEFRTSEIIKIPEDSTLRRHFLTQLQNQIEAQLAPRPSDSTLRRHYENLIRAKMAEFLTDCCA